MTTPRLVGFDHFVLRCRDVETSLAWYVDALGLTPERVEAWRDGVLPFPSARLSAETIIDFIPATGDVTERNVDHVCFVADRSTVDAIAADASFRHVGTPGPRSGARGEGWSVYVLDPDDNLVEVRSYPE